jgi:hypothetical protein
LWQRRDNLLTKRKISAAPRWQKLRQPSYRRVRKQNIPPTVSCKAKSINKLKADAQAIDLQPFPATFPSLQNTCFYPFLPFTYTLSSVKMEIFYIICKKRSKNRVTNGHQVTCTV